MRDVTTASPFPAEISNLAAARATAADKTPADYHQANHRPSDHIQADRWLEIDGWLDRALEDSFPASDPVAGNCCD